MKKFVTASMFMFLFLCSIPLSVGAQANASLDVKLASATDLRVSAGAITLQLQRRLETGRTQRGLLGTRWRLNWESRLSRGGRLIQVDDWTGLVSFTQVGQQPEYTNAAGGRITFSPDGRAVHTMPDGGSETFDANGRLIERTYHHGNKALLRYDARGRLVRVEGPGASFLQFTSDSVGHLIQVESSTSATVRYAYDKDDLTEVQINGGLPLRYGYDGKGSLVKIEDPQTGSLEIAYDSTGRVASYRRSDGSRQRFEYDDATNTKRVIEPNGATTVTQVSTYKRRTEVTDPLGNKSAVQFDDAGHPVTVTGPTGASSRMSYDSLGRIAAAEDALGHTTRYEYAGDSPTVKAIIHADGTRQEFDYDAHNDLAAIKIGGKTVSALTYNPDGTIATAKEPGAKEQRFTYYANGFVKSVANALGEATQFEYNGRGNLVREINPLGGVTIRSYDSQDRLVSLTNPAGGTTRYEYDYRGRLIQEVDPAGGVTKFEYDARGRLASETNPAGQTTRYEYSPVDKLTKTIWPDNTAETYRYDLAGNLIERTDRLGRTFRFERNPLGRVTRERWPSGLEVRYRYDAAGNLLSVEDSSGARTEYQTDALGRNTARLDPSGGKTQYQYDPLGNLLAVTDPLGGVKHFAHTGDGEITQVGEASRDEAGYEYDAAGRVVTIRRPSGGVTRFTYDRMGNLLTATDPLGNVKRYSYDNAGRLTSFTDAVNRVTRYAYDQAGQRVEKQLPDGKRVTYKYDALGRMIEADDGAFPVRMSHDDRGNLKRVEYSAINKAVAYEYEAQGLRTKMIAPDGRETRYEYDALKRLIAVVLPDAKRITLSYDAKNRAQSVAYPNGITGRWDYDTSGQVAKITYQDKSGKPVAGSSYRYDAAGNPVERQDAQGQTSRFAYDAIGQLIEETNPDGAIKYTYAAAGNRATVAEATRVSQYRHDAADRLIQAGAEQLSYDANGNLISRKGPSGATTYEYDAENRLVKVVMPDGATTTFGYAPTGERVWRRDKNGVTYFLYDGINLIAELGNDLRTKTTYVHGLGIDRPLAMLEEKQSYYYAADRVGSITHLTDDNGKVAASYSYDAFGKIKAKQGTVANPFAYSGRELDPTGLYYFRARYYDAALGRFLSNDLVPAKLDEPLEQNPYLYARNSPIRFVDPVGLDSYSPEWLAGQSNETLFGLYHSGNNSVAAQEQIYTVLRTRGVVTHADDWLYYNKGVRQPDGSFKWGWKPGSPPDLEGAPLPGSQPSPSVPSAGSAAANNTGAVNGGSPNRAGANTNAARPQPGPPENDPLPGQGARNGDNTQAVGSPRNGGNTLRVPAAGAPGAGGGGFWTLDPRTVDPKITGAGAAAGLLATAVDCYRNGLANCGPRIAGGLAVGALARVVLGRAAGPIGILVSGGIAWWQVGKEAAQSARDARQRAGQEQASQGQAQGLINDRQRFNNYIAQLNAKIAALRKIQADLNAKSSLAQQKWLEARAAVDQAKADLDKLGEQAKQVDASKLCNPNPLALNSQIEALASNAETTYSTIGSLLDDARQLYLDCGQAQDAAAASQKAAAIRTKYDNARSLAQAIANWKTEAERKNADLKKSIDAINDFKTKQQSMTAIRAEMKSQKAKATDAMVLVDSLLDGPNGIKELITSLDSGGKQLRGEIDKLVGIFSNLPPDSALPQDMQAQLTGLYGSLDSAIQHGPAPDYNTHEPFVEAVQYDGSAIQIMDGLNAASCDGAPPGDAAVQRIDSALRNAQYKVSNDSDLPKLAQVCEASAKCIPLINKTRQQLEQLQIEEGQAGIEQARQAGCNVAGLETALDYYRSIRDAVALLNNAKDQCRFQEALDFAQKFPDSIQNNSFVASAIAELRAGAATQDKIEQVLSQATDAIVRAVDLTNRRGTGSAVANSTLVDSSFPPFRDCREADRLAAQADAYLAQAYQLAASYPCLTARVDKYKGEYDKLKAQKQPCSSEKPTDDVPGALDPGKKNQPPTDDVPNALDPGRKNLPPTDDVPGALDPGKKNQPPTDDVPGALDPGKKNQPPTDDVPGALDPGKKNQPPESSGGQETGKKEKPPRDPNKPSTAEKIGTILGGVIGGIINQRTNPGGGSGGSGSDKGGSGGNSGNKSGGSSGSGGSGGTNTGQEVDLSGTWNATYREPMSGSNFRFQMVLSRVAAGKWQGPLDYVYVDQPNMSFKTQATIQITGAGRIHLTYNTPRDGVQQADGTFTSSQMTFGGAVTYTKR